MTKLHINSLSIFFPFYNDEGTVKKQIDNAFKYGKLCTDNLEVIAIHGGPSKDKTFETIKKMKEIYPELVIIDKTYNKEGYAVIKYGLKGATKDWIFYTDGDAQYHLEEDLVNLVKKQLETNADVINGYKEKRGDNLVRIILGNGYAFLSRTLFRLPIRDTDCDFRLISKTFIDKITLNSHDASILPELLKKLEVSGAKFAEIPVGHYEREYGESNYTPFKLLKEKIIGDFKLYLNMKKVVKGNS